MSKELKPCPFCGETKLTIEDNQKVQDVHVLYNDCGAKTSFDGIRYAVESRWNVRPVEHALQKRIEEIETENKRLRKALNMIGAKADLCADECEYGPDRQVSEPSRMTLKKP